MRNLSNAEAELKKSNAYKKKIYILLVPLMIPPSSQCESIFNLVSVPLGI